MATKEGYIHQNEITTFLFDEGIYHMGEPRSVTITGAFRNWDTDPQNPEWKLTKTSKTIWVLSVQNPDYSVIHPNTEFKFLIDQKWIMPPHDAPNQRNGNLVFQMDNFGPKLRAEIKNSRTIWMKHKGFHRPLSADAYRIWDGAGKEMEVNAVILNTASETLIYPDVPIDITRVHYLEIPKYDLKTLCSYDGWFRELYSHKELGANIHDNQTTFRVFSPRARQVRLYLYKAEMDKEPYLTDEMVKDDQGVWESIFNENLDRVFYDFTVHGPVEKGNHFYESVPVHISDPYTRVSVDTWGKCRVWERTKPATPLKNGIPRMEDMIAYEVHIQDFTDLLPVSDDLKGTIPAMHVSGLKNGGGHTIGFDYLVDLGINVLHLMPVQEYLHYPDAEWSETFGEDPFMKEMGIEKENYYWGYRTSHYFAIESRYARKGSEPGLQRNQFRDLVQAFHDKEIAVVIDIVPNHTAENMDGKDHFFTFNVLDKIYYYRTQDLEHIGEYGNEVKTENRPMVQRWLIDMCRHFINEFGIDGFRIDLAGQLDEQTLIALKHALGPDIILYGEPWIGSRDLDFEQNPDWDWYKEDAPITFFQDDTRNSFKGPSNDPYDKAKDRGYAGGNVGLRDMVQLALAAKFAEEKTPVSGINYLDIHDNWTLADQFATNDWDGRFGVDEDRVKIAALLLYTSQGPIVTHGGTESLRSKGLGARGDVIKDYENIKVYFHGRRDTYNLRKANQFVWENVGKTLSDEDSYCDYLSMYQFWKGLNHLRLSAYGRVFRNAHPVPDGYYQWILPDNPGLLGYQVDEQILIVMNVGEYEDRIPVHPVAGNWLCVANPQAVNHVAGIADAYRELEGGGPTDIFLQPADFRVWVRK